MITPAFLTMKARAARVRIGAGPDVDLFVELLEVARDLVGELARVASPAPTHADEMVARLVGEGDQRQRQDARARGEQMAGRLVGGREHDRAQIDAVGHAAGEIDRAGARSRPARGVRVEACPRSMIGFQPAYLPAASTIGE